MKVLGTHHADAARLAAALVAAVAVGGCGKSSLAKAYESYDAKVEKLLDAENDTGKRLEQLLRAQYEDDAPDFRRYSDYVEKTAVPFYDGLVGKVKDLAPAHPGLAAAQEQLVKFAQFRAEFAHVLAANLDALRHSDTTQTLRAKDDAAERTKEAYGETLQGPAASPDTRFSELAAYAKDFQNECLEPMTRGKTTEKEVADYVESRILPAVRKIRASKFEDDEPSRRLRDAVAAAEEFYVAVVKDLPAMAARARLKNATEDADRAAADALKRFKEELAAVRNSM